VFVDSTYVIPNNLSWDTWNDTFTVSDHRPVGAKLLFTRKSTP